MKAAVLAMAAGLMMGGVVLAQANDGVVREGTGERRAQLDKLEMQTFPAEAWSALSDWKGGEAGPGTTDGKVVVFLTWSGWYPTAAKALPVAQSLAKKHAGEVVVIAAHHPEGWDEAKGGEAGGVIMAHDKDGKFREALMADQDPDFFIVDRAGYLRFADVATSSVDTAVAMLVKETREEAAARPGSLAEQQAKSEAERWKTSQVRPEVMRALRGDIPLNFNLPAAGAYQSVAWPEKNTGNLYGNDIQGQATPTPIDAYLSSNLQWVKGSRPDTKGKVLVVDFWASWCGPCKAAMPGLDALQNKYKDELQIIGINGFNDTISKFRGYITSKGSAYPHAWDSNETLLKGVKVSAIPHVLVISSDGVVRWQGNPHDKAFRKAVEACIKGDPGVAARLEAKAAYLKTLENQGG